MNYKEIEKMDKQEMIRYMKVENKSLFITRQELADIMGYKDPHCVDRYLYGLEKADHRYFIPDVVASIKEKAKVRA